MSNAPIPQPPGPSRPRPSYGGYQPSHGNSTYWSGAVKPSRSRGEPRRFQPSYRPRDPHADHYEPGYDGDKPRFGHGANYSHSQSYEPPSDSWSRRDVMAERMFEPSESWKHDHVPDSGPDIGERSSEFRSRMPPPREDYLYTYGGDSYRTGPSYTSRRDLVYPRQTDVYRPGYTDEGRWSSSYSLRDNSNSWARQRSPSSTSRPPRGRVDYRDVSYEKSLSGSPRSSRFSSPRHSRATASRRAPSPSSSSIRSSRERSKSPPQSRERSRSSIRSSVDSRSYTAEPPVRVPLQRSHPVGQIRGRGGSQRNGMRLPEDGFRDSIAPPFVPPLTYPNESRPEDRLAVHPSLPLRPSPPHLTPGPSGRARISECGLSGPTQTRYHDSQANRGSSFNPSASQQGYQLRTKRKRRGGVNRKKRGTLQHQEAPIQDIIDDSNESSSPPDDRGSVVPHAPFPMEELEAPKGLSTPVLPEPQAATSVDVPLLTLSELEIEPFSKKEIVSPTALLSEGPSSGQSPSSGWPEAPAAIIADTSSTGRTYRQPSLQDVNKDSSLPVIEVVPELPRLVIPPSAPPIAPPPAQDSLHEVTKADSPSRSQSASFSPALVGSTTPPLPSSELSLEHCSTPQFLPINGLPEATTSSPVSSAAPTPSLQTPSPPYVAPVVAVAAPTVQDDLMPASPVSSALQAIGVPTIVHPNRDTFSANAKEAESLIEALHMVVSTRQQLDVQTRGERVNPILLSNRAIAAPPPDVLAPSADTLVREVLAGQRVEETIQAFESHVRNSLVANMAFRQETVDEKVIRLRKEYLALHREWVARCADLDNSHRVDPAGEVSAVPARTTRRSAAVLGDAVRSDLEMEQIIASLGNDELYDPAHLALRNVAIIPDMISVTRGKVDAVFDDTNNAVNDPQSFFDPSPGLAEWTDDEVEIYKQRFAKYPKQFGHIAVGLAHKTQAQCVQFYYLHKKALIDFREAIITYGQSKRRRGGRRTDKKKGGLLADIRQHDAEVSKGQDSVKRRAGAAARRRRESARSAPRRSSTAVQQEEQTPATTPTPEPEPESVRPKRRRNPRPAAEPEPVVTEEPPTKRGRRGPRKPKIVPEISTPEPKPLPQTAIEAPNAPSIEELGRLFMAQYGKDLKRIAESMPKTTVQMGNRYASNLEGYNLGTNTAQAPGRSPTPDPPREDNKERSFTGDVPPMSATSRSHLMDLQSHPFSIPGSSTSSTLHLYS